MKRLIPLLALALLDPALAAEPAAKAEAAAEARAEARADARADAAQARAVATAAAAQRAHPAPYATPAEAEAARKELDALRTQMRDLGRKMGDITLRLGDGGARNFAWRYLGDSDRALLGIVMRDDGNQRVRIAAVTPGGPADKAGVRNDDILLAIDGKAIERDDMDTARQALQDLKVDQPVKLSLERSGKKVDVVVKAARREAQNWPKVMVGTDVDVDIGKDFDVHIDVDRIQRDVERQMRHAQRQVDQSLRGIDLQKLRNLRVNLMPWWGINLAPLNPELSGYFGTEQGVLVLSADPDSMPELKGGDILQSVDGAKVDDPGDVMRRLRDADAGSEVKLGVLRQKKTLTLNTKVPEYKTMFPVPPVPPAPPAPPAPPTAPAPPAPPAPPAAPTAAIPAPPAPPAPPALPAPPVAPAGYAPKLPPRPPRKDDSA